MRNLLLLAVLCAGCLDSLVPEHKMSEAQLPMPDLSFVEEPDLTPPPSGDAAGAAFGASCAVPADCASGLCEELGQALVCTLPCTMLGAADPACPNNGQCNNKGFCKP
jgi:hypothetical protein